MSLLFHGSQVPSETSMKLIVYYLLLSSGIIVAQTTLLRPPFLPAVVFDLFIPLVVFARLKLPLRGGIVLTIANGFVMDLFSGGHLGIYVSIYAWIFFGMTAVSSYFNVQGSQFRSILVSVAVLLENVVLCLFSSFQQGAWSHFFKHGDVVLWQVFLAALTGPVIIVGLERFHRKIVENQFKKKQKTVSLWMTDI